MLDTLQLISEWTTFSFVLLERMGWAEPVKMQTEQLLDNLRQLYEG